MSNFIRIVPVNGEGELINLSCIVRVHANKKTAVLHVDYGGGEEIIAIEETYNSFTTRLLGMTTSFKLTQLKSAIYNKKSTDDIDTEGNLK